MKMMRSSMRGAFDAPPRLPRGCTVAPRLRARLPPAVRLLVRAALPVGWLAGARRRRRRVSRVVHVRVVVAARVEGRGAPAQPGELLADGVCHLALPAGLRQIQRWVALALAQLVDDALRARPRQREMPVAAAGLAPGGVAQPLVELLREPVVAKAVAEREQVPHELALEVVGVSHAFWLPAMARRHARGGIRTRTPFRAAAFETAVSAIPPPGPVRGRVRRLRPERALTGRGGRRHPRRGAPPTSARPRRSRPAGTRAWRRR